MFKDGHYKSGIYEIVNKDKYLGKTSPVYRSSWEERTMKYLDLNKKVLKWSYEKTIIPYISPIDNKVHRYFVDFFCVIDCGGVNKKFLVEVKPNDQTKPPKQPKNKNAKAQRRYLTETKTFVVNQSKWKAATEYCNNHDCTFIIITEKDLFNN